MHAKPMFRRFLLTMHVIVSVGWLGALAAYLALAVAGLTSGDPQTVRGAYVSMALIGWSVIVPLGVATLAVGLIESLRTPWGLFRHWWVVAKLLLTAGAVVVLLQHMPAVTRMSDLARQATLATADFRDLRMQLVAHATGGLLVLLVTTALSIFKPWGATPYGRRKQAEQGRPAAPLPVPAPAHGAADGWVVAGQTPRWVFVVGLHGVGVLVLLLVVHLAGGGAWVH